MTLYAFSAQRPLKAAHDLREAGYTSFCLMMMERRDVHRHTVKGKHAKGQKTILVPIMGLRGYAFAVDVDPWRVSRMPNIHPVRKADGRWQPIKGKQAEWLLSPPHPLFHDTEAHRYVPRTTLPDVAIGDMVAFMLARERVEGEVLSNDGHHLLMRLNRAMLGRDTVRVPLTSVEKAA